MRNKTVTKVLCLRTIPYRLGLDIQNFYCKRLVEKVKGAHNTLLVLQHTPVYTVGIRTKEYTFDEESRLTSLGAEFHRTNRGGLITFHGPGQLVAYPIFNLQDFNKNIREFVCTIEKSVISLCEEIGITASTSPHTGVWVGDNKICAIGLHRRHNVTSHGLALNCDVDLKWFNHIVPCGIKDKGVTSISQELGRQFTVNECTSIFLENFGRHLGADFIMLSEEETRQEIKEILENHV